MWRKLKSLKVQLRVVSCVAWHAYTVQVLRYRMTSSHEKVKNNTFTVKINFRRELNRAFFFFLKLEQRFWPQMLQRIASHVLCKSNFSFLLRRTRRVQHNVAGRPLCSCLLTDVLATSMKCRNSFMP